MYFLSLWNFILLCLLVYTWCIHVKFVVWMNCGKDPRYTERSELQSVGCIYKREIKRKRDENIICEREMRLGFEATTWRCYCRHSNCFKRFVAKLGTHFVHRAFAYAWLRHDEEIRWKHTRIKLYICLFSHLTLSAILIHINKFTYTLAHANLFNSFSKQRKNFKCHIFSFFHNIIFIYSQLLLN